MSLTISKYHRVPVILLTAGIFGEILALQNSILYQTNNYLLGFVSAGIALFSIYLERKVN